jgi:hypothetical protein
MGMNGTESGQREGLKYPNTSQPKKSCESIHYWEWRSHSMKKENPN